MEKFFKNIHIAINRFFDKHIDNIFINSMFTTHIGRCGFAAIMYVIGMFTIGQYQEHLYEIDAWYFLACFFAMVGLSIIVMYTIIIMYNAVKNLIKK